MIHYCKRIQITVTRGNFTFQFTNKTNGKTPNDIEHPFHNICLYILYFKFWLYTLKTVNWELSDSYSL